MNPFIEPDELQAILAIKPDAKFNIADNRNLGGTKTIEWHDKNPTNITQKQIAKAWRKRWLNKRILNENIKKTMMNADPKSHTLKQKIEQLRND